MLAMPHTVQYYTDLLVLKSGWLIANQIWGFCYSYDQSINHNYNKILKTEAINCPDFSTNMTVHIMPISNWTVWTLERLLFFHWQKLVEFPEF